MVWQGSAGDRRPYADPTGKAEIIPGPKSAPEELVVILLLPGSAGVGSGTARPPAQIEVLDRTRNLFRLSEGLP